MIDPQNELLAKAAFNAGYILGECEYKFKAALGNLLILVACVVVLNLSIFLSELMIPRYTSISIVLVEASVLLLSSMAVFTHRSRFHRIQEDNKDLFPEASTDGTP